MKKLLASAGTTILLAAGLASISQTAESAEVSKSTQSVVLPTSNVTNKVVVFFYENKGYTQMKSGAPKIWALGQKYGYASNFKACTHPSSPNYICTASGSQQGVKDNAYPSSHKLSAANIFGRAWANGRTAKIVADGMGTDRCRQTNYGKYVVRHTAWPYFYKERALCEKYMFDFKYFAGDVTNSKIANVEWVIPNNCNNAHDCSIKTADNWIAARVATLQAGPDWKSGELTIVITGDEDNKKEDNRVLTVVIHPSLSGKVVSTPLTLYSLSGFLFDHAHNPRLLNAATAPDMAAAFGLQVK